MEKQFNSYFRKTISIRDTFVKKDRKENFYHGILLGLLGFKGIGMYGLIVNPVKAIVISL